MLKSSAVFILLFCFNSSLFSQINFPLTGTVKDYTEDNVINFASVYAYTSNYEEFCGYVFTESDGSFELELDCSGFKELAIIASYIGYIPDTILLDTINLSVPLSFKLRLDNTLPEVVINTELVDFSVEGDTLVFKSEDYAKGDELVIEDLLRNIPGIEITDKGIIKYQGKTIHKFMIEGDDILGNNYQLGTKNLNDEIVESIDIFKNYTDNPLLKGIEQSDKVALNISLKDEFKSVWVGQLSPSAFGESNGVSAGLNSSLLKVSNEYRALILPRYNGYDPSLFGSSLSSFEQDANQDLNNIYNINLKDQDGIDQINYNEGEAFELYSALNFTSEEGNQFKNRILFNRASGIQRQLIEVEQLIQNQGLIYEEQIWHQPNTATISYENEIEVLDQNKRSLNTMSFEISDETLLSDIENQVLGRVHSETNVNRLAFKNKFEQTYRRDDREVLILSSKQYIQSKLDRYFFAVEGSVVNNGLDDQTIDRNKLGVSIALEYYRNSKLNIRHKLQSQTFSLNNRSFNSVNSESTLKLNFFDLQYVLGSKTKLGRWGLDFLGKASYFSNINKVFSDKDLIGFDFKIALDRILKKRFHTELVMEGNRTPWSEDYFFTSQIIRDYQGFQFPSLSFNPFNRFALKYNLFKADSIKDIYYGLSIESMIALNKPGLGYNLNGIQYNSFVFNQNDNLQNALSIHLKKILHRLRLNISSQARFTLNKFNREINNTLESITSNVFTTNLNLKTLFKRYNLELSHDYIRTTNANFFDLESYKFTITGKAKLSDKWNLRLNYFLFNTRGDQSFSYDYMSLRSVYIINEAWNFELNIYNIFDDSFFTESFGSASFLTEHTLISRGMNAEFKVNFSF